MKIKKLIYGLLGTGGILVACDKIEEGYMSSNIYYVTDPFTVEQGLTTYSEALELDNSTGPVNVELFGIMNTNEEGQIIEFEEKTKKPKRPGIPKVRLLSGKKRLIRRRIQPGNR